MMIHGITGTETVRVLIDHRKPQRSEKAAEAPGHGGWSVEDKVSLQENSDEAITYGIPQTSGQPDSGFASLREMLARLLEKQGVATQIAPDEVSEEGSIDFRDLTPEKARELVSEDGPLGVEAVSDRIVQFALSLIGNDPERLEEIKAIIDEGFQMAAEALGGTLPDISTDTHDTIFEKLDAWAEGFNGSTSNTDDQQGSTDETQSTDF